jgi:hypothetical protein
MSRSDCFRVGWALIASLMLFACAKDGSDEIDDQGTTSVATPQAAPDAGTPTQYPTYDAAPDTSAQGAQDSGSALPPVDSGSAQQQDSGAQAQDSGSTVQDSGSPPQDSGGNPTNVTCDLSSPLKIAYYQYELTQISNPQPCPCNAGDCCYLLACVPQ